MFVTNIMGRRRAASTSAKGLSRFGLCAVAACVVVAPAGGESLRAAPSEPGSANWKTIVLPSADAIPVAAPPSNRSRQTKAEIRELIALRKRRTAAQVELVRFWNSGVVRWNETARALVIKNGTVPPSASRIYALLSVAQHDALLAAFRFKYSFYRPRPAQINRSVRPAIETADPSYPSGAAAVAGASAEVLKYLFPDEAGIVEGRAQEHQMSRLVGGVNFRSDISAGDALGRAVAARIIERARGDRSDAIYSGTPTEGPGNFVGVEPILPQWGGVRPWLVSDITALRPPPPPAYGSAAFNEALAEVRRFSDTRTDEQLRIAQFWADGAGTYTPPGHWNAIASDLILGRGDSEPRAARVLAYMNMAQMDAGIGSWDAKYFYYLLRPYQADPAITTPVGRPNFPSYTSGHASFSGAASEVLSFFFPGRTAELRSMAEEAAMSRLYGGIHYRFDSDEGLKQGRILGALAVQRAQSDGA